MEHRTPEPEVALLADVAALLDHRREDATRQHEVIASALWRALRDLGVAGGRMLVAGEDAEVYAGLPAAERRIPHGTTRTLIGVLPDMPWPHGGLPLRLYTDDSPRDGYDLVITNIPDNDVVLHDPDIADQQRELTMATTVGPLASVAEGGIVAALAASEFLDHPDSEARQLMRDMGDLIGAVRLPAGALRSTPGNDLPVDLLLSRRHWGEPTGPARFTESIPVTLDGHTVRLNQYYDDHPDHVLGTLVAQHNPWGPPTTTVLPTPEDLGKQLANALADITTGARISGLTAATEHSLDLDAPISYSPTEPRQAAQNGPVEIPVSSLDEARAVVARLREERRNSPAPNHEPRRPPRRGSGHDGPGL